MSLVANIKSHDIRKWIWKQEFDLILTGLHTHNQITDKGRCYGPLSEDVYHFVGSFAYDNLIIASSQVILQFLVCVG